MLTTEIVLTVVAVFVVVSIIFRMAPRVLIAMAVGLLAATAPALASGNAVLADRLAMCALCFLVVGVILLAIQETGTGSEGEESGE